MLKCKISFPHFLRGNDPIYGPPLTIVLAQNQPVKSFFPPNYPIFDLPTNWDVTNVENPNETI